MLIAPKSIPGDMKKVECENEEVWCSLWGDKFVPSRLRIGGQVRIVHANDPGDIGTMGRYRGKPRPYGLCDVECTVKGRGKISYLARHLAKRRRYYLARHASHVVYSILWRGVQGNMEFSAKELANLAKTRVAVAMDYMFTEE
jgi:hypothetical protein